MQNKLNAMQKKSFPRNMIHHQKRKIPPGIKTGLKSRARQREHMELLLKKKPINLKTLIPNVGYAFEYFHCYNEIQTILTTCLCTA